ncbi:hypothetical protein KS18_15560 [Photorhabdus luminescens]|nr:hypothetical protein KS18_15560 [Photorhabdus luminescens]
MCGEGNRGGGAVDIGVAGGEFPAEVVSGLVARCAAPAPSQAIIKTLMTPPGHYGSHSDGAEVWIDFFGMTSRFPYHF